MHSTQLIDVVFVDECDKVDNTIQNQDETYTQVYIKLFPVPLELDVQSLF